MVALTKSAQTVFAPTDGGGNPRGADMAETQVWGSEVEAILIMISETGLFSSGGVMWKDTRASLDANLLYSDGTMAWVGLDSTPANNGIYVKSGSSGSGSWIRKRDLPDRLIALNVTGGTANAIVATAPVAFPTTPFSALFTLQPTANNEDGGVTVTVNGNGPYAIADYNGNPLDEDYLIANQRHLLLWNGTNFQSAVSLNAQYYANQAQNAASALSSANLLVYPDEATADAATIPAAASYIVTADEMPYLRFWQNVLSDPGSGDRFQSADGQWWKGLPAPPATIDIAGEISRTANVTLGAGDMDKAHVFSIGSGSTIDCTLPAASSYVGRLLCIRVDPDSAGLLRLKGVAVENQTTDELYLWAGEVVMLLGKSAKWNIIGKRQNPLIATLTNTGADISITSAIGLTTWDLAAGWGSGSFINAVHCLAASGSNIIAPRRTVLEVEFAAVVSYSAAPTYLYTDLGINSVAHDAQSRVFHVLPSGSTSIRHRFTRNYNKGDIIAPRITIVGGTSVVCSRNTYPPRAVVREIPIW